MEPVVLIILIGLAGGAAVGLQSPLASMISQRLGILESVFIVHLGGAIIALVPLLLFMGGGKLSQWRSVPWYALCAGVFGLIVITAISYMIPRGGGRIHYRHCGGTIISRVVPGSLWPAGCIRPANRCDPHPGHCCGPYRGLADCEIKLVMRSSK